MKKLVFIEADTVDTIKQIISGVKKYEQLKDEFLQAAKLERTPRQPLNHDSLVALITGCCVALGIFMAFSCIALNIIF